MRLSDALTQFISWLNFGKRQSTCDAYRTYLMQFSLFMRNADVESVLLKDVLEYLEMMKTIGWDINSFLAKTVALRKFFEYWGKQKMCQFDYTLIPIMERQYKIPQTANIEDFNKVISVIPQNNDPRHIRNRAILMLCKDTGMRLGEFLSLDITDLDLQKMEALIQTEKTKKLHPIRKVFWTDETNQALQAWINKRRTLTLIDKEALFVSTTGLKRGIRLCKNGATEIFRRLSHAAKLPYIMTSHTLRHMFGHDLAKANIPNSTISTMLGHATPVSSYIYTMLNEDEMATVYKGFRGKKVMHSKGTSTLDKNIQP